jgi:hypothetical protein
VEVIKTLQPLTAEEEEITRVLGIEWIPSEKVYRFKV